MPCGHVAVCAHEIRSLQVVEPRLFSAIHFDPLEIIVSRRQQQVHERDIQRHTTAYSVCLPSCVRTLGIHISRLSSSRKRGVEMSVSHSGPDVFWHHDYPFLVPFTGAASKSCGAFARRMIDARQFIGVPSMQSHARCFAQVMPILQPSPSFARQRARSCPSQ